MVITVLIHNDICIDIFITTGLTAMWKAKMAAAMCESITAK